MVQYVSGIAAYTSDNFVFDAQGRERQQLLPGAFDEFDLESEVPILVNHDWAHRIGAVGDNARLWLDGSKLRFSVLLRNNAAGDRFREQYARGEFAGCSIACTGFCETRHDKKGPYTAISRVLGIRDLGPVGTPVDAFCYGIELTDYSPAPRRSVTQVSAIATPAVKKRHKPLMIVPPMPQSMLNGMAIAAAAKLGSGCMVKGVRLSAESVQNLIQSRHQAVR